MKTTLSDGEQIAMATLAAAATAAVNSADGYFNLWLDLCAKLQQNKLESVARIKATRKKRR
jgi:hypothetical protein